IIGVASVTSVVAAVTGLKQYVLEGFETFGTNKIYIFPSPPDTAARRFYHWRRRPFRPEDFDGLADHCPAVANFTRVCEFMRTVTHESFSEQSVEVKGIEPSWHQVQTRSVTICRPFRVVANVYGRPPLP